MSWVFSGVIKSIEFENDDRWSVYGSGHHYCRPVAEDKGESGYFDKLLKLNEVAAEFGLYSSGYKISEIEGLHDIQKEYEGKGIGAVHYYSGQDYSGQEFDDCVGLGWRLAQDTNRILALSEQALLSKQIEIRLAADIVGFGLGNTATPTLDEFLSGRSVVLQRLKIAFVRKEPPPNS